MSVKREYNNKDEDKSLNTLNDKNYQASSQKFRQIMDILYQQYILHRFSWSISIRLKISYQNY